VTVSDSHSHSVSARMKTPAFHVTQVAPDRALVEDGYRRLFGQPILDGGFPVADRRTMFTLAGDLWLEAVTPETQRSGIRKFSDRVGSHFHSVAWYVSDIDGLAATLREQGVRYFDAEGNTLDTIPLHGPIPLPDGYELGYPPGWWSAVLFTHPRDTNGLIEFCESMSDHPLPPRPGPATGRSADPLGIVGLSHLTLAVRSLQQAVDLWVGTLGGELVKICANDNVGTRSAYVRIGEGEGTMLEFAEPVGAGPVATDLDRCGGDVLHAVTFRVADLEKVKMHLDVNRFSTTSESEDLVVVDPGAIGGGPFGFTTRSPWS
jgi:catechol 2,3-dioxygenase-like lactoylglutathione lyase family enzyme